jgi:hypothetical protein
VAGTGEATAPEWVVCLGTYRDVVADAVRCPLSASAVSVADCLECRHLNSVSDERGASRWCATGESDGQP